MLGIAYFWVGVVCAKDIYVSPSGSDLNGMGTVSNPYATVQKAVNAAASGDILYLRKGTYAGNIKVSKANITIRSYTGEWAVISSPSTNSSIQQTVWFTATGGQLLDLELVGGYYYTVKFETGNAVVRGCKIHDSGRDCIKIVPGADDITIQKCEIYNSGKRDASNAEGIDNVNGDRMRVQDCYIHHIATNGVYPKGGAIDCIIERCLVTDCGGGGVMLGFYTDDEFLDPVQNPGWYENIDGIVRNCIVINTSGAGVGMYAALRPKVYNNTLVNVAGSTHAGIVSDLVFHNGADRLTTNPTIINNIVTLSAASSRQVVDFRSAVQRTITMSNNRYYDAGGAGVFRDNGINYTLATWKTHISGDAGSTEGNPDLDANYHLASGSPCINTGATIPTVANDYDGGSRTAPYDIGADEFGACTPLPVPPPAGIIGTGINCTPLTPSSPTVGITSPATNATITAGSQLTISASASDSDGSITKVEFYQNNTKLGEDTSSPYSFVWTNVPAGTYSLTAKATDNSNTSTTSTAIAITVQAATQMLEAENASIGQGVKEAIHMGYTGTGYVNYNNITGSYVEWAVNALAAGSYQLQFRFVNGTPTNRPAEVRVNGTIVSSNLAFNSTGTWENWQATTSMTVNLNAGTNLVRATATTAGGGANIDHLLVSPAGSTGRVSSSSAQTNKKLADEYPASIYPNPASDVVYVTTYAKLQQPHVKLVNAQGTEIKTNYQVEDRSVIIYTDQMHTGVYQLFIESANVGLIKKTIVISR
jgi:hypothetical protein